MKQIIIALGREFGSGGHVIAKKLAEHYNIPLYNKELLDEIAKDGHFSKEMLEKFDERPISISFMRFSICASYCTLSKLRCVASRPSVDGKMLAIEPRVRCGAHIPKRNAIHLDGISFCVITTL